jgi:hypothetical protein
MNIQNSADVKNRIRIRSILIAVFVYIIVTIATAGIGLAYALIAVIITTIICNKEIESVKSNSTKFKKTLPFKVFGSAFGDFQHVFHHTKSLEKDILDAIETTLKERTPIMSIVTINLTDIDKNIETPEKRNFILVDSGLTKRGTSITLIIKPSEFGRMQSIRWWVLVGGYIDKDKKFNFIAYSPLTLPFWSGLLLILEKNMMFYQIFEQYIQLFIMTWTH